MKAEQLFAKASARGIDLRQIAEQATNLYGPGAPRRRSLMERLAKLPVRETASGKQSRVAKAAFYTHAELGQALGGLKGPPYHAAMYSFALDESQWTALYLSLRTAEARIAETENWEVYVRGTRKARQCFQDEMADLVLTVDWYRPFFTGAPSLYAIFMDVPEETWAKPLMKYYLALSERYERWLSIARAYVDRMLIEEFRYEQVSPAETVRDPANPAPYHAAVATRG